MQHSNIFLPMTLQSLPAATAKIYGGQDFPDINGTVRFYNTLFDGIIIEAEIAGLPAADGNAHRFLGFHIHENGDCSDNFENTGNHFNPSSSQHPLHSGDLPPLLNNNGYAYTMFYDDFLSISGIIGRSVVIHSMRDDFSSQPSGDSGSKIACGVIAATAESAVF